MADNNERLAAREFLRIDTLWAWIAADDEGEGVLGGTVGPGCSLAPLIGADKARIERYRDMAMALGQAMGRTVRLVHFTTREELEVWPPAPAQRMA